MQRTTTEDAEGRSVWLRPSASSVVDPTLEISPQANGIAHGTASGSEWVDPER